MDDNFIVDISPDESVQAEILPTNKYPFTIKEVIRGMDQATEDEFTLARCICQTPEYRGWEKAIRFFDDRPLTKANIRLLKACGLIRPEDKGKKVRVNLGDLERCSFIAMIQRSSSEEFGVFNRITEFRPPEEASDAPAMPDLDDDDD